MRRGEEPDYQIGPIQPHGPVIRELFLAAEPEGVVTAEAWTGDAPVLV